jgi:hypothetical protein
MTILRRLALAGFALLFAACVSATEQGDDAGVDASVGDLAGPPRDFSAASDLAMAGDGAAAVDLATPGRNLSSDRDAFFGASRCAQANVKLCEDFESGMLDKNTWSIVGTAPVIDGLQAARGSKALHITMPGNGPSYIRESKTFPAPNDTYYGRAFVYFNKLPTAGPITYAHWTILAGTGTGVPGEIRVSGQLSNGRNLFGVGTDNRTDGGTGDWTNSDKDPNGMPMAVPTGQWLCIEWLHKGDTNETRFYWDAVEHPSLHTTSTMHGGNTNPYLLPQFTAVWVGWQEYQATTEPFELWVDEIAIDYDRIGCVL